MSDFNTHDTVVPSIEHDAPNGVQSTKDSIINGASNAAETVKNHPITQNISATASSAAETVKNHPITQNITNGPVAENVKNEHAKTVNEFSSLAATKQTPQQPAATGQPLTHYHSFFYSLLSWEHPRASGIAYLSTVLFIFAARYLDIIRYTFKATYMVLAITVLAEAVGKAVLSHGLTTQIRPRKYYTVPKDTINSLLGDVHELINFFVIEAQQIVFAENLLASTTALLAAFISYYLIKFVPFWGLSIIGTTVLFGVPLVYTSNKEFIDAQIEHVSKIVGQQTEQAKALASQHASTVTAQTKSLAADYSAKAQEMIGSARGRSVSPTLSKAAPVKTEKENVPTYKNEDFPLAPKEEFKSTETKTPIADSLSSKTEEPLMSI